MERFIEKYAIQCTSWPYWRDMPEGVEPPPNLVEEWPAHVTEQQKDFWRAFVSNMINDLKRDVAIVETSKLDQIINLLNK